MAGRRTWQSAAATDGEGERGGRGGWEVKMRRVERVRAKSGRQVMKLPLL